MSAQTITLSLYLILTVLYLPLIVALYRRPAGQDNAAILLGVYLALASMFTLFEGLYRAGEFYIATPRVANDFQIYGALLLSFLLTLAVLSFIRRRRTATSTTLVSQSKFMSQTREMISVRESTSPWRCMSR